MPNVEDSPTTPPPQLPDGWESWPPEAITDEATAFVEQRAAALTGISEEDLKSQFGAPDEETPGTRWMSADDVVTLQADRDLRYFQLLPHVVVSFSLVGEHVARIHFSPKWRQCPPEFAKLLGASFAPE
jgi:hypothetical protein